MAAIDNTQGTAVLKAMLAVASLTAAVSPMRTALGSTVPTATAAMTQLPNGNGYVTNGTSTTFNTVTNMATTGPTTAITWTNTSGSSWTIAGAELWDSAGSALRWFFGSWNGQPITVANNNGFQVAIGGESVSLS